MEDMIKMSSQSMTLSLFTSMTSYNSNLKQCAQALTRFRYSHDLAFNLTRLLWALALLLQRMTQGLYPKSHNP
jgi:hypothetical protein